MSLEAKLEAILFFKGEPVSIAKLESILKVSEREILDSVASLKKNLEGRGVVLIENNNQLALRTAPEFSDLIEHLQKEELNKELSKASLETLSIVLYKNGTNRAEIDYIRGVNSSFTLRALSVRGLVEKIIDPEDNRRYLYRPSFELLSYLGIKTVTELPDFGELSKSLSEAKESMITDKED
ncbi:MAG TPA: SMC-Scp complex subunit ScpB [Candidatus Paceibacterota bacterium]